MSGESCGSKPGRQRKDGYCAGRTRGVGGFSLADDGARQVSVADVDLVRIFCLPRPPREAPFAIGLLGWFAAPCWRSSVVEHSLGKGEVESSSLSVSSRFRLLAFSY